MINKAKFMELVRLYRSTGQQDVSTYAANFSYAELIQGRKTALVERIEKMFRRPIDQYEVNIIVPRQTKEGHKKGGIPGINYKDDALLEKVLNPDFNQELKIDTYKRAYREGKTYVIVNCPKHGNTIHRVSVTVPRPGLKVKKNAYDGYCLICKTVRQCKYQEKIESIQVFYEKAISLFNNDKQQPAS